MSKEYSILEGSFGEGSLSDVKMQILQPDGVHTKIENVKKEKTVCKKCNGEICLDDGEPCNNKKQCGGGYCIEGYCSDSILCYDQDCKCSEEEVQCEDNTGCVKKKSVEIGSEPICSFEECKTKYINVDGFCDKRPKTTDDWIKFTVYSIILLVIVLFLGFMGLRYIKAIIEDKKRIIIETEIQLLNNKNIALEEAKKELKELEQSLQEKKQKKEQLENIEAEIKEKKTNISELKKELSDLEIKEKEWTEPYKSKTRGFWEWRNPNILNKYYPCYWNGPGKNNDIEIHKDLAEKEIFGFYRKWFDKHYPSKAFSDLIVHHVDKDLQL